MEKIALVINNLSCGGTERQVSILANGFAKNNDVTLFLLSAESSEKLFFLPMLDHAVKVVNCGTHNSLYSIIKLFFYTTFRKYKFVSCFNSTGNLVGSLVLRFTNPRSNIYCNVRGNKELNYQYINIWKWFVSGILTNSEEIKNVLLEKYKFKKKVSVVNNGIDLISVESKIERVQKTIIAVGRITPVKNHYDLIHAAAKLQRNDINFLIIGDIQDSSYKAELDSLIKDYKLDNVQFLGAQNDLTPYYKQADLLLITSVSEGLPNVLLEAVNHELPSICSSVGQIPKVITHNKNGFLYKCKDVDELSLMISNYLKMTGERKDELRQEIRSLKKKFGVDNIVDELMIVFRNNV